MIARNSMAVIKNSYQGNATKVLCVCSGGVLRSPTAAWILSNEPFNFNTRSCGDKDYALIPLSEELVTWADEIVVMDEWHAKSVKEKLIEAGYEPGYREIHVMNVPDDYDFKNPELVRIMTEKFCSIFGYDRT